MIVKLKGVFGSLVIAGVVSICRPTQGQVLQLGTVLNGIPPSSNSPWITATFSNLFPGGVSLTLTANFTTTSEFIGEIGLNLRPGISPASLNFAQNSGPSFSSVDQPITENSANLPGAASERRVWTWWSGGPAAVVRTCASMGATW
jgi:hypothetical protein